MAEHVPYTDDDLRAMWRSVSGPHAALTGPLIRFAGLVQRARQPRCVECGQSQPAHTRDDIGTCERFKPATGWVCAEDHDRALAAAEQRIKALEAAVLPYVDWFGGVHEEDCPADDTCDCSGRAINDPLNAALRVAKGSNV